MKSPHELMNVRMPTGYNGGHDHRQQDAAKDAIPAATVDLRGFIHVPGNAANELHHQEDIERAAEEGWHRERQERAHPAHLVEQHKAGIIIT